MSIPKNDSEEKQLEELRASTEKRVKELRPLAEERDREAKLASKARGGGNQAKAKRREVPEKDLLELGGEKAGSDIIFGTDGGTQLIFRRSDSRLKGVARWTVSLPPVTPPRYDLQRELSKANRGLWDKEKGEPSVAYRAVEQLLACHAEKLQALHVEVTPLHELSERPETEAVMEQLVKMSERLDTVNHQLIEAQAAIGLVVDVLSIDALSKRLGKKLQIAFVLLRDDSQWRQDVTDLQLGAMKLAGELQRPPTKKELRESYDPGGGMDPAQFSRLLKAAGLGWLPDAKSLAT